MSGRFKSRRLGSGTGEEYDDLSPSEDKHNCSFHVSWKPDQNWIFETITDINIGKFKKIW